MQFPKGEKKVQNLPKLAKGGLLHPGMHPGMYTRVCIPGYKTFKIPLNFQVFERRPSLPGYNSDMVFLQVPSKLKKGGKTQK